MDSRIMLWPTGTIPVDPAVALGVVPSPDEKLIKLRAELAGRLFDPTKRPPEVQPVFSLAGVGICTAGNLTAITSHAKVGKSAFIGAMKAAVVTNDENADTFGLKAANPRGLALVHFDTEQSPEDHWHQVERALRRAGAAEAPPWLLSYCLTGLPALHCWELIKQALEDAAQQFGGLHSFHSDGVGDLVKDVNDPAESNAFVAELHGLAIRYACPGITVLHFNPGTEKTRGHLGSQLEWKSETNLTLEKDGEVTAVWSTKQRRAPIPKDTGPRFRWCNEAGMHVSTDPGDSPRQREKLETLLMLRHEVFRGRGGLRYRDLISTVMTVSGKSEKTAERIITEWKRYRQIEATVAGIYTPTP